MPTSRSGISPPVDGHRGPGPLGDGLPATGGRAHAWSCWDDGLGGHGFDVRHSSGVRSIPISVDLQYYGHGSRAGVITAFGLELH